MTIPRLGDGQSLVTRLVLLLKRQPSEVWVVISIPHYLAGFLLTTGCCGTDVCRTQFLVTLFNLVAYLHLAWSTAKPIVPPLDGLDVTPWKNKRQAHETLSLMFKHDGVPPCMIVENSKGKSLGEFRRKCREVDCHLVNTEPYSPWQQAYEGCIKQLKKASSRKLISSGAPKKLWYQCIELMALICSHTAHTAYELQGEVPETIMTGQTAEISNICEYDWYEWVMFLGNVTSHP